jgi:hypothetical protein
MYVQVWNQPIEVRSYFLSCLGDADPVSILLLIEDTFRFKLWIRRLSKCYERNIQSHNTCKDTELVLFFKVAVNIYFFSVHRRHRMERCEVLPSIDAMADACENVPGSDMRRATRSS